MVSLRVALTVLIAVLLAAGASSAGARSAGVQAPTDLHGFLLRADEPASDSFPRTPAFAWNPVRGAASYEFQLSISSTFRDNGIVWRCPSVKCPTLETPVAAPTISLPWITGSPHGLYARVRSVAPDGTKSAWGTSFGFDIEPSTPPTPLPSLPGVLRWTPVAGANAYEVWLIDAKKQELVYTNVLDERDFYTLHAAPSWISTVRWRIRAVRRDWDSDQRVNGVPVTPYGPWSPIYKSTNPNPAPGQIRLGATISDVSTTGKPSDPAHRLMPAFTWNGNETLDGDTAEFFRVYVFTDKQCLNTVFTSSVVGSPSYAPRPYGGLSLPTSLTAIPTARQGYLPDLGNRGAKTVDVSFDGKSVVPDETEPAAKATVTLPLADGGAAGGETPPLVTFTTGSDLGAPVSLWDDDWPHGGYYWTVVPVQATTGTFGTKLGIDAPKGSTAVLVSGTPDFKAGDTVVLGQGATAEVVTIQAVAGAAVTLTAPTVQPHSVGDPIGLSLGTVAYQDMELPQDVCAAGRVARFGINSEPSLTAGDDPFASGLSPSGRLTSAVRTDSFYKSPLVSWTPALGASAYQVQWSETASPFAPVAAPGGGLGILTGGTSYVLPLPVGTWYYRVRGIDWSLPQGAQQMGWSDVTKIVVSGPQFKVVQTVAPKKKR